MYESPWTTDEVRAFRRVVGDFVRVELAPRQTRWREQHHPDGYMSDYPIARMWTDSRVERIYAGTNEVMNEVIAWSL